MSEKSSVIGHVVFVRTDTVDFSEEKIQFTTLEEMVQLCSHPPANLALEKIVVEDRGDSNPCAISLAFVSATRGSIQL